MSAGKSGEITAIACQGLVSVLTAPARLLLEISCIETFSFLKSNMNEWGNIVS